MPAGCNPRPDKERRNWSATLRDRQRNVCGRYIIRQTAKAVKEWEKYGPPPFLDSYNVAPTQLVPVLRTRDGKPEYADVRWGLVPFLVAASRRSSPRSTHGSRPSRRRLLPRALATRPTMPATRKRLLRVARRSYGRKAPYLITIADQELFGFAALWDRSVKRGWHGSRELRPHHDAGKCADGGHPQFRE